MSLSELLNFDKCASFQYSCRNNRLQVNETFPVPHGAQYDEIDSVYYNPSNLNGRPERTTTDTPLETLLSSNNDIILGSFSNSHDGTQNENHEIIIGGTNIIRHNADNVSSRSSSDDLYLVTSQKYINPEIGVTLEHIGQTRELGYPDDCSTDSNSESSETHMKSNHQYETLTTMTVLEHLYERPIETK